MDHPPVTLRDILKFYLPLVLTAQMMTLSSPIINLGLGRTDDPKLALAAFAVGFTLSVFFHSPLFVTQQVATALLRDRKSFRAVTRYFVTLGACIALLDAAVALTGLGDLIFIDVIGATPRVCVQAKSVVLLMSPIAILITFRGIFQSLAIQRKRTILVTASTFVRLVFLIVVVFLGVYIFGLKGANAGAVALTLGVASETTAIFLRCRSFEPRSLSDQALCGQGPLTPLHIFRFSFPLMLSALVWTLQRPLINAIISRTGEPELALAGYGLVQPLMLLTASPMFAIQSTALVLPATSRDITVLKRFVLRLSVALSGALLAVTALAGHAILDTVYATGPDLLLFAAPALILIFPEPIFLGLKSFSIGLILQVKKTRIVAFAALTKVCLTLLLGLGTLATGLPVNGAVLGVLLMLASEMWDVCILYTRAHRITVQAPSQGSWTLNNPGIQPLSRR